jgi:hypothetical protein
MITQAKVSSRNTAKLQKGVPSGVFPQLVDRRAFIDKIVLSIRGDRRKPPNKMVKITANRPIGGQNRNYARSERGLLARSRNPYEMRYGALRLRGALPSSILILRSEARPTTISGVTEAVESLCEVGSTATVSQIELTFDLSGVSVGWLRKRIFTRARTFRRLRDSQGRQTFYVGGRTSPWQVRVYDKWDEVVRLEFILRRPFLRKIGVNSPPDLVKLRDLNLRALVRIRRLNKLVWEDYVMTLEEPYQRAFRSWLREMALSGFAARAKECGWNFPPEVIVISKVDRRIQEMQERLVA